MMNKERIYNLLPAVRILSTARILTAARIVPAARILPAVCILSAACVLTGCSGKTAQTDTSRLDGQQTQQGQQQEQEAEKEQETQQEQEAEKEQETQQIPAEGGTEEGSAQTGQMPLEQSITLTATGDCALGPIQTHSYAGSFHEYYDKYGEEYFFRGVRDIFEADDFTLVNLECVLTDSENRVDKEFNLKGKPEYVGIMASSSVEGCSLGNNHSCDYGWESLIDTQNMLDERKIIYGFNEHTATYTTEDGLVIGIVSASLLPQSAEREAYIHDGILKLQEQGADLIVACCHWGIEREYYPSDYQKTMAHKVIDWGADLVVGHHPHVLQGIEYYNSKLICYSLGNFCFGGNKNPSDKDTMIFQQTFHYTDGELQPVVDAAIIPCTLSSAAGYNDFQPTVAQKEKKARIIGKMNDYSAPYSGITFDEEGTLCVEN